MKHLFTVLAILTCFGQMTSAGELHTLSNGQQIFCADPAIYQLLESKIAIVRRNGPDCDTRITVTSADNGVLTLKIGHKGWACGSVTATLQASAGCAL